MKNAKEPAYPITASSWSHAGLTKREYFAAMAMQGMAKDNPFYYTESYMDRQSVKIAQAAAKLADALLKELEEEDP